MPENLMNSAHKSNSDAYRENLERIFPPKKDKPEPWGARPIDPFKCGFIVVRKPDEAT
jgi:hypothetical protein